MPDDDQITVFKSLGVAAQDLAVGVAAFHEAEDTNRGVLVEW